MIRTANSWGVHDLTVRYGAVTALDNVTVAIAPGEVIGVIGGDGAGKSTLLKVLAGERLEISGAVSIPAPSEIGFVPATGGFYGDLTIEENIEFIAAAFGLNGWRERAAELLAHAELDRFTDRLANHLSGGQQRKLAATMALLPAPRLLVLDEVTTGVDPVSRMALWRILGTAAAANTSIVVATTYLDEAERTNTVLLLEDGKVLAAGPPAEITAQMPGTLYELDAPTDRATAWRHGRRWRQWTPKTQGPDDGSDGDRNAPSTTDQPIRPRLEDAAIVLELTECGTAKSAESDEPTDHEMQQAQRDCSAPDATVGQATALSAPVVRAVGVSHKYGSFLAVDGVDLTVGAGEIIGLIGANGAGKTTLIKMLLGVLAPTGGSLDVLGGRVSRQTRRQLGYVPQHLGLYPDLTANENLAFQAAAYGVSTPDYIDNGDRLIGDVPLGVQRQVAFAAAVQHDPELLILDEPTSGVSPLGRSRLWDVIHDQADRGVAVLVSTHYMDEARQADRIAMLSQGRLVAHGTLAEVLGGRTVVNVAATDWSGAFNALDGIAGWTRLDGRAVRVVGASEQQVRDALAAARVDADVSVVPATLDEVLALHDRAKPEATSHQVR